MQIFTILWTISETSSEEVSSTSFSHPISYLDFQYNKNKIVQENRSCQFFSSAVFGETRGIALALVLSLACKNCDNLSYLCHYRTYHYLKLKIYVH